MTGVRDLVPGDAFPDLELPDSDGHPRRLADLGPFLSDVGGAALDGLGLRETTDAVHDPDLPTVWLLRPDLRALGRRGCPTPDRGGRLALPRQARRRRGPTGWPTGGCCARASAVRVTTGPASRA